MSAGAPTTVPGQAVSVVDVVLRLDAHADRAVVAAVARQLTADPSRLEALQADLTTHPEYLMQGSTRSRQVTQEFARALFAVGVRGAAFPRCHCCGSTSPMVMRLRTDGGGACGRCELRMTTNPCSRCARVAPMGGRTASGKPLCERCAGLLRAARCPGCDSGTTLCRRPEHGAVRCPACRPTGGRRA